MTRRSTSGRNDRAETPEPVDVVDGIPDRSGRRAAWKYWVIILVFLAWVALLVYIQLAGRAGR